MKKGVKFQIIIKDSTHWRDVQDPLGRYTVGIKYFANDEIYGVVRHAQGNTVSEITSAIESALNEVGKHLYLEELQIEKQCD